MDMDREIRESDASNATQVDGNQTQSMNESQGYESLEQSLQDEATNLVGNKRKLTSDVWNHFDKKIINGEEKAECKYCHKLLAGSSRSGTSHLREHMNNRCKRRKTKDIRQQVLSMGQKTPGGQSNLSCYSFDANSSREDLAEMIIVHEYPLVLVEHHGFRKFVRGLQPLFRVPCRNTVKSDILKIYDFKKQKTMRILEKNASRIAVTTDMWTSSNEIELLRKQLQGAKRREDTLDIELAMDMMIIFSKNDERNADIAILERLAKRLDLYAIGDLEIETVAVKKLVKERGNTKHVESTEQIVDLLKKFKQVAGFDEDNGAVKVLDDSPTLRCLERCRSMLIPHEFLCPISLEIMTDPVIIATGQTYERENIHKWLTSNHRTCPKTGETLSHVSLAPNFALRNLILQWCEKNNFELPKKETYSMSESQNTFINKVSSLVQNMSSSQLTTQSEAVEKIRMLSKENPENRILIANCGAIPPLVKLLYSHNWKIKEHSVTALLNLSLDEANKRLIAREGAIPAVIEVLQNGTDEARENSAATLFSLSMLHENKVMIGSLKGIPPLVKLLQNGTVRGKKDAATALFNLSLNQSNKSRAIKAGIIEPLLHLLKERSLGMVDEALSILSLLAKQPEGQSGIGRLSVIETLVGFVKDGTPKNKECATAVLLELGLNNSCLILAALQYGVYDHLVELSKSGTSRAQRKANALLQQMSKCEHIL